MMKLETVSRFVLIGFTSVIWTWNCYADIKCVFRDTMDVFNDTIATR